MDGEHFDAVIRSLRGGCPRRGVLGALAGLLALRLGEAAGARRHRQTQANQARGPRPGRCGQAGQPCKYTKQCCAAAGLVCIDGACGCTGDTPTNCGGRCVRCPSGGVCSGTSCGCPANTTNCDGTCATCPTGGVCSGTSCVCPAGQTACSGTCYANSRLCGPPGVCTACLDPDLPVCTSPKQDEFVCCSESGGSCPSPTPFP